MFELLLRSLEQAEKEGKERDMAPVVQRITSYLQTLFPGAAIHCDEQFKVTGIIRELQQAEFFDGLSVGTQEQIAVLTRLAFAEMLLDRGKPATVILDDALVYSDPERMERMFDLLTQAAERTQILILTCREDLSRFYCSKRAFFTSKLPTLCGLAENGRRAEQGTNREASGKQIVWSRESNGNTNPGRHPRRS